MMRVEFDYCIMHHCRFRVTNRVSLESLQACPEIQVVTLSPARISRMSRQGARSSSIFSLVIALPSQQVWPSNMSISVNMARKSALHLASSIDIL